METSMKWKLAQAKEAMRSAARRLPSVLLALGCGFAVSAQASGLPELGKLGKDDTVLRGDAKCTGCHDDSDTPAKTMLEQRPWVLSIAKTRHGVVADGRTPTCTSCHGESALHMKKAQGASTRPAPDRVFSKKSSNPPAELNESCLSCHKGGNRTHWNGSQHPVNDVACTSCHQVHAEHDKVRDKRTQPEVCYSCHQSERAQARRFSTHPLAAGKMACSDCHNPHGSAGPKLLRKKTLNETCYTCHAEKRGPFLFEHRPAVEDCAACHTPHGSNITPLLKSRPPFMCQECHDGTHASATQVGPNAAGWQGGLARTKLDGSANNPSSNITGRGCMNCHVMIHGSNSPAGGYLQR